MSNLTKASKVLPVVIATGRDVHEGVLPPSLGDERMNRRDTPYRATGAEAQRQAAFAALISNDILKELNRLVADYEMDSTDDDLYLEACAVLRSEQEVARVKRELRKLTYRPKFGEFQNLVGRVTGRGPGARADLDHVPAGERQAYAVYRPPAEGEPGFDGTRLIAGKTASDHIKDILRGNREREEAERENRGL